VYLVGAGPGDPQLLTLKGRDCLARADVVVDDHLANSELLSWARDDAEIIYVGKRGGQHTLQQDQINQLLIDKALEGKTVVRLKGGDPYVFGRGGEEALALEEAGLRFEVVPGVTAAVAAATYAGIALTHRTFNSVVTFVTGHEDPRKEESRIDWRALAAGGGTLVFYMGVKNLPQIVDNLIDAGKAADTPVALIQWGTLPIQRVVEGTLATIVQRVEQAKLAPPCIIVIGQVVKLREKLNWFERLPLFGRTIVVTRPRQQASALAAKLEALGANVLAFPTIRIEPPEDNQALADCVRRLCDFDWIVFTSANGVDQFFDVLRNANRDSRSLHGCKICCIGSGTAAALSRHGVRADLVPGRFTSEAVFDALAGRETLAGKRFLLPRADIAGRALPAKLQAAGAEVTDVAAYRTLPGQPQPKVLEALQCGQVDIVTFTSSSTARNYAAMISKVLDNIPGDVAYVSIGPETSRAARAAGLEIAAEARQHTIDGLVELILSVFGARQG